MTDERWMDETVRALRESGVTGVTIQRSNGTEHSMSVERFRAWLDHDPARTIERAINDLDASIASIRKRLRAGYVDDIEESCDSMADALQRIREQVSP